MALVLHITKYFVLLCIISIAGGAPVRVARKLEYIRVKYLPCLESSNNNKRYFNFQLQYILCSRAIILGPRPKCDGWRVFEVSQKKVRGY